MGKCILVITDGIGYSEQESFNAFKAAKTPTYDQLFKSVPYGMVATYGLAVGLPEGQMGNSEVGHMTIGSGRVSYQDLVKISKAVKDGSLATMPAIDNLVTASQRIHLVGLVSDGGVHSHIEHLEGLVTLLRAKGCEVVIHIITDGRDTAPTSGLGFVKRVEALVTQGVTIGSLAGRFYTMDRDKRWERVEEGYHAIVGDGEKTSLSPSHYLEESYAQGTTDEFIKPKSFEGYQPLQEGDGILFYNFRSDRMRQLVDTFGNPSFKGFERPFIPLHIVTMTEYAKDFSYPVVFSKEEPQDVLAEVVSRAGLRQFHTAETEKYAHVTFFLNGGREEPFAGESRVLIPSPKVKTYDEAPQMSAFAVKDAVLTAIDEGYEWIVVNFANGDMVGHTGHFDAAIEAVEAVDTCLGEILQKADSEEYCVVITSDHGNCEEMKNLQTGEVLTNHTVGDVWCFVKAQGVTDVKNGALNHIAPTVLKLLELPIPATMDEPLI